MTGNVHFVDELHHVGRAGSIIGRSHRDGIVTAADINVTFGSAAGDRTTLSKACLVTVDALYRHPIAHNIEWSDVVALFTKLGTVHQKPQNDPHHFLHHLSHKDQPASVARGRPRILASTNASPTQLWPAAGLS